MASTDSDVLASVFTGLKNKNPEVRLASAVELRRYVAGMRSSGMGGLGSLGMGGGGDEDQISRRLFELCTPRTASTISADSWLSVRPFTDSNAITQG